MVFQKRTSSEMESCGGSHVAEMPRVPKSARVCRLRLSASKFGLAAPVGESDSDGVSSCFLKCAGEEIG